MALHWVISDFLSPVKSQRIQQTLRLNNRKLDRVHICSFWHFYWEMMRMMLAGHLYYNYYNMYSIKDVYIPRYSMSITEACHWWLQDAILGRLAWVVVIRITDSGHQRRTAGCCCWMCQSLSGLTYDRATVQCSTVQCTDSGCRAPQVAAAPHGAAEPETGRGRVHGYDSGPGLELKLWS